MKLLLKKSKLIFSLLSALLVLPSICLGESSSKISKGENFTVPQISRLMESHLIRALTNDSLYFVPQGLVDNDQLRVIPRVWRSDIVDLYTEIQAVKLYFRKPEGLPGIDEFREENNIEKPDGEDLLEVTVDFPFENSAFTAIFRTNFAKSQKYKSGARVNPNISKDHRVFMNGAFETGWAFFLPKSLNSVGVKSILMCPRTLVHGKIVPYDVELVGAEFQGVEAELTGRIVSGFGGGSTLVRLQTTPTIPKARMNEEFSDKKFAVANIAYLEGDDSKSPVFDSLGGHVEGGVRGIVQITHTNGERRTSVEETTFRVRNIELTQSLKVGMPGGYNVEIGEGPCYIVSKERSIEDHYDHVMTLDKGKVDSELERAVDSLSGSSGSEDEASELGSSGKESGLDENVEILDELENL